jgi:hypothetical protein
MASPSKSKDKKSITEDKKVIAEDKMELQMDDKPPKARRIAKPKSITAATRSIQVQLRLHSESFHPEAD